MIDAGVIFVVLLIYARKQVLILLTYLFNIFFEKCALDIVSVASSVDAWHLLEWGLLPSHILCSLKIIQPT